MNIGLRHLLPNINNIIKRIEDHFLTKGKDEAESTLNGEEKISYCKI